MEANKKVFLKCVIAFIFLGSIGVTLKMVFCGYTADDAYHVAMSYRRAMGDRLFMEMWEPHQTSAFLCACLIKLFITVTGSVDYLVIFLKICGLLIQGIVTFILYRTLKLVVDSNYALLVSMLSYSLFPKLSAIPEFSNMSYWCLMLSLCFLLRAFLSRFENICLIIISATFLSLSIVSYPTGILVSVAYLAAFLSIKEARKPKAVACFFITCVFEAVIYFLLIIAGKNVKDVIYNMKQVFAGDSSHLSGMSVAGRTIFENYFFGSLKLLLWSLLIAVLSLAIAFVIGKIRKTKIRTENVFSVSLAASFLLMMGICFVRQTGFDCLKVHYIVLPVLAVIMLFISKKDGNTEDALRKFLCLAMASGLLFLIGVCLISNLELDTNIPLLQVSLIWSLVAAFYAAKDKKPLRISLIIACILSIGFTGYVQKPTAIGKNIFQYNAINNNGPAKRVICDWVIKGTYESANEELKSIATAEDSLFIVSDDLYAPPSELYMITDAKIGQYSTICTPSYGEAHFAYWEEFPDRLPTVVLVEKGRETLFEESAACKWLFGNYKFDQVLDGTYYTYYRRVR